MRIKYEDVIKPIKACKVTAWYIEFKSQENEIALWHRKAKIEDVVKFYKVHYPNARFTVSAINTGIFKTYGSPIIYQDGRKLNQNMRVIIFNDDSYNEIKNEKIQKKKE